MPGMTIPSDDALAPDLDQIARLAAAALAAFPEPFQTAARSVAIRVEDFATPEVQEAMEIDDPFELTGLYEGIPMTEKSVADQAGQPDVIWLFRRPILDEWLERGNVTLAEIVPHVVVHEFAHHFGWDDGDIASVDQWWD